MASSSGVVDSRGGSGISLSIETTPKSLPPPSAILTGQKVAAVCGVRIPVMDTRPDRSLPAHSRHDTLQTADKLAAIMRAQGLDDHKLPGSHTRSLSVQRQPETRELTSDGQPENRVGRFRLSATNLNSQKPTLTLALSQRERGLTESFGRATLA